MTYISCMTIKTICVLHFANRKRFCLPSLGDVWRCNYRKTQYVHMHDAPNCPNE